MTVSGNAPRRRPSPALAGLLSLLVPGAGQLYAGDRRRGILLLAVFAGIAIAVVLFLLQGRREVVHALLVPRTLLLLLVLDAAVLAFHAYAVVDAAGQPSRRRLGARRPSALLLGVLVAATAVPHAAGAWYDLHWYRFLGSDVFVQGDAETVEADVIVPATVTVASGASAGSVAPAPRAGSSLPASLAATTATPVSTGTASTGAATSVAGSTSAASTEAAATTVAATTAAEAPPPAPPAEPEATAPWQERGRVTILLLGGDRGPGRSGLRTDTMIVATIDTDKHRAALFSVPRNLGSTPLPAGAPATTFDRPLNELYGWASRYPEVFRGRNPGATALMRTIGGVLGLHVDYYALVDFPGFVDLVDALGGVDLVIPDRVLDRVSPPDEGGEWIRIDLQPGRQHLSAREAFAYVRARSQSSDYSRIRRQRCVLGALAAQTDPLTLLRSFDRILEVVSRSVETNVPVKALPDLIDAATAVDTRRATSLSLAPPDYTSGYDARGYPIPDVAAIHAAVASVVRGERAARQLETLRSSGCA